MSHKEFSLHMRSIASDSPRNRANLWNYPKNLITFWTVDSLDFLSSSLLAIFFSPRYFRQLVRPGHRPAVGQKPDQLDDRTSAGGALRDPRFPARRLHSRRLRDCRNDAEGDERHVALLAARGARLPHEADKQGQGTVGLIHCGEYWDSLRKKDNTSSS